MNKKIIIIIAVVVVLVILAVVIMISSRKPQSVEIEEPTQVENITKRIVVNSKSSRINSVDIYVDCRIPQFENLESTLNSFMNSKINNELDYRKIYDEMTQGIAKDKIGKFTYETSFERHDFGNFISLVVSQKINLEGSREISKKKCYVVDVKNSSSAMLKDVFKNKTNYKKAILNEINKQAEQSNIMLMSGKGLTTLSDMQSFYIKDGALYIYFEAAEIASASDGELDFKMPFNEKNGLFIYKIGE